MSRLLTAETLVAGPLYHLTLPVILQNCFDRMDYQILLKKALKHKYPAALLALALPICTGPRLTLAEDMCFEAIFPERGVLPGRSLSVSLTKLYTLDCLQVVNSHFHPEVSLFVDDVQS